MRLIGTRWAAEPHAVKVFLTKSQVPYRWQEAILKDATTTYPLVVLADGSVAVAPYIGGAVGTIGIAYKGDAEVL